MVEAAFIRTPPTPNPWRPKSPPFKLLTRRLAMDNNISRAHLRTHWLAVKWCHEQSYNMCGCQVAWLSLWWLPCSLCWWMFLLKLIAFDELKTDYKNPIDQCNSLNPVRFFLRKFKIFFVCFGNDVTSVIFEYSMLDGSLWDLGKHWPNCKE